MKLNSKTKQACPISHINIDMTERLTTLTGFWSVKAEDLTLMVKEETMRSRFLKKQFYQSSGWNNARRMGRGRGAVSV